MRRLVWPLSLLLLSLVLVPWPAAAADREDRTPKHEPSALALVWQAVVDRLPVLSVFEKLGSGMDPNGQPTPDLGSGMDPWGRPTPDLGSGMDPNG